MLMHGGVRVKCFKNLIMLQSRLKHRLSKNEDNAQTRFREENEIPPNWENYIQWAVRDQTETAFVMSQLHISKRTAWDYMTTLSKMAFSLSWP